MDAKHIYDFDKFVLTCLQVMGTPIETLNKMGLIQFSGKGPWAEYEQSQSLSTSDFRLLD